MPRNEDELSGSVKSRAFLASLVIAFSRTTLLCSYVELKTKRKHVPARMFGNYLSLL
jgi:hypothetical protein